MPPHPSLLDKIKQGEIAVPYTLSNIELIRSKGVDEPWSSPKLQILKKQNGFSRLFGPEVIPTGNWRALVILVQFSDKSSQANATYFDNLLFSQNTGTLCDYYNKVSYGNLDIVTLNLPSSIGWLTAPQPYSYYVNAQNGEGSYPHNSQKLVEDIVNLVDPQIDFSQYDNDGDGYVDALFIVHSGSGADYTGNNNDMWSHSWVTNTPQNLDGVKVYHYSIEPEFWQNPGDMTCGVFAHEMGHSVFGLPDLYDTDYSSYGLGNWSLMAGGSWNGNLGSSPAFPDAWSHIRMGYLTPTVVSTNISGQLINNVENIPEVYFLQTSQCGTEYFLVENRQQISYDTYLPGNGIFIYHIDDAVNNNNNEWYPGHTSSGHYRVALEQANGLWNLEHKSGLGDNGDTYPGFSESKIFNSWTIPDSKTYNLTVTGIEVSKISSSSLIMSADFKLDSQDTLPQFKEQASTSLTGVWYSSAAWGDYDNDGYLDLLLTGNQVIFSKTSPIAKIYHNNGDNTFVEQSSISLIGVSNGSVAWGDYDNDGYLDILLAGTSSWDGTLVSKIYHNNRDNTFTEQASINLPGVRGSVEWGDYDNDGYLDLLLVGNVSKIFRNNRNNTFTEQTSISLPNLNDASGAWGDYDNDGYLDILLTGFPTDGSDAPVSKIYHNNQDNTFTDQTTISLAGVWESAVAWGDYDNDGYLDIILTGSSNNLGGEPITKIYHNNGNNTFTEQSSISLAGVRISSVAWGDYDNDGYLDIFIGGFTELYHTSKIYHNNGDNTFTEQDKAFIKPSTYYGSARWGDYDNDGDLDLILTGIDSRVLVSKIYRNNNLVLNTIPSIPTNLVALVKGNDVTLSWNKSTDNETPQNGLTYNLVLGTSPGACDILSPMSDINTGKRRIVNSGNAGHCNSKTIKGLADGRYYWSVQAIDNNFAGSKFASTESFVIGNVFTQFTEQPSISLTDVSSGSAEWGDYDNDGDLDILITGLDTSFTPVSKLYRNDGNNVFIEQTSISLTGVRYSSAAWGDYDNDGYLDILLTGSTTAGFKETPVSKIYRNNGDNTFTEQTSIELTGVSHSSVAWGDYNNDGFLDILLTGYDGQQSISKIYLNNKNNTFSEQNMISLSGVSYSSAAWGDYDNDGNLDVLLTGYSLNQPISKIYQNNGDNTFSEQVSISLVGISESSVAWGDYDNDGDLDILLTGQPESGPKVSKIYRNEGNSSFTEQTSISLTGVSYGSAIWGDYDNDGNLDILLTGYNYMNDGEALSIIYRNNGDNTFDEQTSINLNSVWYSSVAWGDYDNDGDLDLLVTGNKETTADSDVSKIYRNNNTIPNSSPSIPSNLKADINGNEVVFSWDKSSDNETEQNGLTYNLVLGTIPGACDILSPMSDINNGKRRIVNFGNAGHCNSKTIRGLADGKYYWSVQAIDNNFEGSQFAPMQLISLPLPVELTSFKAVANNMYVILNWETSTEFNNYGYEIERSMDSVNFLKIGFANGNGTSSEIHSYKFIDDNISVAGNYFYRLKQIDYDGSSEFSKILNVIFAAPKEFELLQNYPNPFNPTTTIRFSVPRESELKINVYSILGQKVLTAVEGKFAAGFYKTEIDATNLPSGIYIYRLESRDYIQSRKMVLLR